MNTRELLDAAMTGALRACGAPEGTSGLVRQSSRADFGHYQANGIMAAAKSLEMAPRDLAAKVLERLSLDGVCERIEVAGPGFINLFLGDDYLTSQLSEIAGDPRLGVAADQRNKVVVDYSAPNLAKEMHVGHLRSTSIGDAVVRLLEFKGNHVIRANHMGDWGSQFGRLLAYMERFPTEDALQTELSDLEKFYRDASALYEQDDDFAAKSREYVVRLQRGEPGCRELWQQFIHVSIGHCQEIYDELNITLTPQDVRGESAYEADLPAVIEELESRQLVTESDGALCVFLEQFKGKDGSPLPAIVRASSGAYPYITTDLAAARYRSRHLGVDAALYVVDARQTLHLQQLFAISEALGYIGDGQVFRHLSFGTIMGDDGKPFKTRSGDHVKLADVLSEAKVRAYELVSEKSPSLDESQKREVAARVGIAAVKYAELSKNRVGDYVFRWDTMLSFEGNTAPYLLYAYTRIVSIFSRAGLDVEAPPAGALFMQHDKERALAVKLLQFDEALESVLADYQPNLLCSYLYELSGIFMSFYEACPVLGADEKTTSSRLELCAVSARTLALGLSLLGIETVERM